MRNKYYKVNLPGVGGVNLLWGKVYSITPDLYKERAYVISLVKPLPIPHLHDRRKM
jgi:hypothetical protein